MKLALVTGSTHRLGAAIAARLGEAGYSVALHASHEHAPDPELESRLSAAGVRHHCFVADLSDERAVAALVPDVAAHFAAPVDLLVNNASLFASDDADSPDMAALVDHFRINGAAPMVLAQAVAEGAGEVGAAVVNILDQRVRHPHRDQQAYTVSKQALWEITRTLAVTLAPRVRVNAVAPGLTLPTDDYGEAQMARLARMMPLDRLPSPDDIADAVLYLAGARSSTGQTVFVDGGASLKSFDRDFVRLGRD
ncbi:SDR family oxidoreductase [Stakelama marina]|uniref:SDR family oxidoreductase n=1 Tax=Stakelama marina TaxID=2826939 RepID=A0A8T4IBX2_9SPHN|nr:SDR family oxidoreductase [Stakelama marina]MBR0551324.1 SDR family oxidoreductase [Stakelama marina]